MKQERTVIVTGGASGIGFATARALLSEGWRVAIVGRNAQALEEARRELGDHVRIDRLDVTDEAAVAMTVAAIARDFGDLRGVVNSAGVAHNASLLDTSAELFRRSLDVNLTSTFLVTREVVRHMRDGGAVVNVASVAGMRGSPGRAAYAAAKGGVVMLTKALAVELASSGVRVNAISPGPTDTPMIQAVHTQETREAILRVVPQHRYGTPEEMGSVIAFLLDDRRSGYMTGQVIAVDGGITASAGWSVEARRRTGAAT
jgi:NAD(P)-dependent dehydrogenase (short-subunit alcohol dehydrogenase family)